MHLSGKCVLVTGGTDGIGAALIRALRDKGAEVIASGRSVERVAATRDAGFEVIAADLSSLAGQRGLGQAPAPGLLDLSGAPAADHDPFLGAGAPLDLLIARLNAIASARRRA